MVSRHNAEIFASNSFSKSPALDECQLVLNDS